MSESGNGTSTVSLPGVAGEEQPHLPARHVARWKNIQTGRFHILPRAVDIHNRGQSYCTDNLGFLFLKTPPLDALMAASPDSYALVE
ncbi:unnamed protein product [Nippostrongylus brasiliensis]|uniref:Uncharacterized protein n=1 Tax=Nippostrongylus brasiliensis TaxID=27835 RepID=A0A0N4Y9C9_NIPBR|nr:unnamed protein product [Nippostrongylus brasiliensis]